MTELSVKFQLCANVGGGHGSPFSAHVGEGSGGPGEKPPGPSLHIATAAIDLTVPLQGSAVPADVSRQDARPTQAAVA